MVNIDMHHNLTMNNSHRNPLLRNKSSRLVNNLFYNQNFYTTQVSGGVLCDIIGNRYKDGPLGQALKEVTAFAGYSNLSAPGTPSLYMSGNMGFAGTIPSRLLKNQRFHAWKMNLG